MCVCVCARARVRVRVHARLLACASVCIWKICGNRQIISTRGKQVKPKKHQWLKTRPAKNNRSPIRFRRFLFSFFFFVPPPFFFFSSGKIHAPWAHYKERNTQACIPINLIKFVVVHGVLLLLLYFAAQTGSCLHKKESFNKMFFSASLMDLSLSSLFLHFLLFPFFFFFFFSFFFSPRLMRFALIIRREIDKYAFLLF